MKGQMKKKNTIVKASIIQPKRKKRPTLYVAVFPDALCRHGWFASHPETMASLKREWSKELAREGAFIAAFPCEK